MGTSFPKQFLMINGRTVLEHAVFPFEELDIIDDILVVTNPDFEELCRQKCSSFTKVTKIVPGGCERQDSVNNALAFVDDGYVLIHDGARPYVTEEIIKNVLVDTAKYGAAVASMPVKDTIRQTTDSGSITPERSTLYSMQTPQGFETALIKKAFERAYEEGYYGTDDASLVDRLGQHVALSAGSYGNIKITTKEDLPVQIRIGSGYDVHRLEKDRRLVLCGEEIPFEKGLLGHSDADVAVHALMDAMLGAAGLGDIGRHFPDNDMQYKDISSIKLLKTVKQLLQSEGFSLNNADVTIMAQRPKLSPHIDKMRENIARALDVDIYNINIKATTTENLGFVGREEGIAAEAVCILNRC